MSVDRPESFFRQLHPDGGTTGRIVLERKLGRTTHQSQVWPKELESISRRASNVPDINFSIASFSGRPLALNFDKTTCLHVQTKEVDSYSYMHLLTHLELHAVPAPSLTASDGQNLTLFWLLDTPICSWEFYKYSLLQKRLHDIISLYDQPTSTSDITGLVPLVGTINSKTKKNICIIRGHEKRHSRQHLERILLAGYNAQEFSFLQTRAGTLRELLALYHDRVFTLDQHPEQFDDWLIFFGSALCHFCSAEQLKQELFAVSESLDPQEKNIQLIDSICATACMGQISHEGNALSINYDGWPELIHGCLKITQLETAELKLHNLSGIDTLSPHLHLQPAVIRSIGSDTFIPIERLLLTSAG